MTQDAPAKKIKKTSSSVPKEQKDAPKVKVTAKKVQDKIEKKVEKKVEKTEKTEKKVEKKTEKTEKKVEKKTEKVEKKVQKEERPVKREEGDNEYKKGREGVKHIDDFKKYFGRLISKEGDKQKLINKMMNEFGTFLNKFALKKLPSKVIQQGIKLGDAKTKVLLIDCMLKESFDEIVKSKYGRFLAKKCVKYGTKEQKARIFKVLLDNLFSLIGHPEGSQVLDYYMKKAGTPHQLTMVKNKLKLENIRKDGAEQQKDEIEQTEEMENLAVKLIEKELFYSPLQTMIINQAFPLLVEQEQSRVVEALKEKMFDFCLSREACQLAVTLVNTHDNKFRKNLIKLTKGKTVELISDESVFKSHLVMKVLLSLDDTKLLNKTVLKEMSGQIGDVFMHANGCKILFNLYTNQQECLKVYEVTENLYSKKDPQVRNTEIVQQLTPSLVEYLTHNLKAEMLSHLQQSRVIQALLKQIVTGDMSEYFSLVTQVLDLFTQEVLFNKPSLLDQPDSTRVLKLLIQLAKESPAVDKALAPLVEAFSSSKHLLNTLESKAVYILVCLIENTSYNKQILKLIKKPIKSVKDQSKSGVQILLKHL